MTVDNFYNEVCFRNIFRYIMADNFTLIVILIIALIIIYLVIKRLQKKGKIPNKLIRTGIKWVIKKIEPFALRIVEGVKNR